MKGVRGDKRDIAVSRLWRMMVAASVMSSSWDEYAGMRPGRGLGVLRRTDSPYLRRKAWAWLLWALAYEGYEMIKLLSFLVEASYSFSILAWTSWSLRS